MSGQQIAQISAGDQVKGQYLVVSKELRQGGRSGQFLNLTLCDSTGSIPARIWDNAAQVAAQFSQGDVVQVTGTAEDYRGETQLRIVNIRALPREKADPSDYLPRTKKDIGEMEQRLAETVKSVGDEHLRELLLTIFRDEEFRKKFITAPGAKSLHHAYIGGLLEHTVEVLALCEKTAEVFPQLNRDLLISAAILHDIGKIDELTWDTGFDYSDDGKLLGHLVLGERRVRALADQIPGFPEETKLLLSHLILSHHGQAQFGSPKVPMTAEAIALHHAEDLDAKVNMFLGHIGTARSRGQRWTDRHFLLERSLYVGPPQEAEEEE